MKYFILSTGKGSKSVWGVVFKALVAVATALAGVFGLSSCIGR